MSAPSGYFKSRPRWADVARAVPIERQKRSGRIEIFRVGSVPVPVEKFHCEKLIEKVRDVAGMQSSSCPIVGAREPALSEGREEIESDRRQQDFRVPETECSLQNCVRCWQRFSPCSM
jgi:hypothetical protein